MANLNPDFTKISFPEHPSCSYEDWKKGLEKKTGENWDALKGTTLERIPVDPLYTAEIYKKCNHLDFMSGIPPFLRGPYSTMYVFRPWTVRQYAGFSTAEESNAFYRRNLAAGQKGLSIAFDLPTHRGYDADNPRVVGDVGKAGVSVCSMLDMNILFSGIPLDQMSVSMTMNGAVLPILSFFIVSGEEQGVDKKIMAGTIQNDILKEFMVRNTYIYPPDMSMRIIGDIFEYTTNYMPKFNSISISGYHIQECGATCDLELGYTLADGMEYIRTGERAGLKVDAFAKRLSFFWDMGKNYFMEVAKMRAARVLWAKILKSFGAKNPKSMALRTHSQTFPDFRLVPHRTGSVQQHLPYLYGSYVRSTGPYPVPAYQRTGRSHRTADRLLRSYYLEYLTNEIIRRAWAHIQEVESLGGMAKAIATGLPKMRIEECAARRQANIDSGKETIVGLNKYRLAKEDPLNVLSIDNTAVRNAQIKRLEKLRAERNPEAVARDLAALTAAAESRENGNLLECAVQAARDRASLGEISDAIEKVSGRFNAVIHTVSGVYSSEFSGNDDMEKANALAKEFEKLEGRRPRIFLAKMGQDGHDRGQKVLATSFADMGWDVDVGPLFQTPEETAQDAVDNDVHMVGFSSLAAGHKTLLPALVEELAKRGREDILVTIGGVIPAQDYDYLYDHGAAAIFGPGTNIPKCCIKLLQMLVDRAKEEAAQE